MKITLSGLAAFLLVAAIGSQTLEITAAQKPPVKSFPVAFWCGPPEPYITVEQYRLIKEAGFTMVAPPCEGANTVERNRKILDTAKAVGLKVLLADSRMPLDLKNSPDALARLKAIVSDYGRHSALYGYYITDEPGAGQFEGLAEVVKALRELDPKHSAYINLFPNYATSNRTTTPSQLQTDTYDQYLEKFVQTVKPEVLSYDHYHFLTNSDRPGFLSNLAAAQRVARDANIPFWNIVLSVQHGPYRALTENELRYEAMQTLAYGARGLVYFTYWLPPDDATYQWKHGIMNRDGTPGPLYEAVKKVNAEVQALGVWLYNTYNFRTFQTGNVPPEGRPQPSDVAVRAVGEGDLSLGLFRDDKGMVYVLVTNRNYKEAVKTRMRLSVTKKQIEVLDTATGKWKVTKGETEADEATLLDVELPPAGAKLLRWR
jgi:hypothetical protein